MIWAYERLSFRVPFGLTEVFGPEPTVEVSRAVPLTLIDSHPCLAINCCLVCSEPCPPPPLVPVKERIDKRQFWRRVVGGEINIDTGRLEPPHTHVEEVCYHCGLYAYKFADGKQEETIGYQVLETHYVEHQVNLAYGGKDKLELTAVAELTLKHKRDKAIEEASRLLADPRTKPWRDQSINWRGGGRHQPYRLVGLRRLAGGARLPGQRQCHQGEEPAMNDLPIIDGRRPCPDCGVLSEYTRDRNWECPACGLIWHDNDPPLPPPAGWDDIYGGGDGI